MRSVKLYRFYWFFRLQEFSALGIGPYDAHRPEIGESPENAENRHRRTADTVRRRGGRCAPDVFASTPLEPSADSISETATPGTKVPQDAMLRAVIASTLLAGLLSGCHALTRTKTDAWPEVREYCRGLDEMHARHQATRRAVVALRRRHPSAGCDFRSGFVQAYVDVALGGSGATPPIPPERYWKSCDRDPEGHCEAADWFAGYAAGGRQALASKWHAYNTVPASGEFSECTQPACAADRHGW